MRGAVASLITWGRPRRQPHPTLLLRRFWTGRTPIDAAGQQRELRIEHFAGGSGRFLLLERQADQTLRVIRDFPTLQHAKRGAQRHVSAKGRA